MPGGGPSIEGQRWTTAKHPDSNYRKPFLVDNVELGRAYRKTFLLGLRALVRSGKLKLGGEWSWLADPRQLDRWCRELKQTDWNVFIEGPPDRQSKPQRVLHYLTRYLTGGPIGNDRIIGENNGRIYFWARSKEAGNRERPHNLAGAEFVRRWTLHILPKGFTRARRYGGYHASQCPRYLRLCQELLPSPSADDQDESKQSDGSDDSDVQGMLPQCPDCQAEMQLMEHRRRPSWKQIFEVEIYRDPSIYSPVLHYARPPP